MKINLQEGAEWREARMKEDYERRQANVEKAEVPKSTARAPRRRKTKAKSEDDK